MKRLSAAGMEVVITDEIDPGQAVRKYQAGKLKNLNTACDRD